MTWFWYKATKRKKEHKEYTVFTETGDEDVEFLEKGEGVLHITHVNIILHSTILMQNCTLTTTKSINRTDFLITNLTFLTISIVHWQDRREFCIVEGITMKTIQRISMSVHFSLGKWNCTVDLRFSCATVSSASTFLQHWNNYIQKWKYESDQFERDHFSTKISENPNVSLGFVDCSLYTRSVMLKEDYHKKRMSQLGYSPVEYNQMETSAKTYIIPARQTQFFQENVFNNPPIRPIAKAMNSKSAFTGSFAQNPFWYQQFHLRDIIIFRGGQLIVHHDTTDNCRLYIITIQAMIFQEDIPSIPIHNFKAHYVPVLDLTSMQDATEHCHYPKLIGEPLRLELYFSSPLENVTEGIVWGERMSSDAVDKFGVVGKNL